MENIRCCIIISCLISVMSEGRISGSLSLVSRLFVKGSEDMEDLPPLPCVAYEQPPNASLKDRKITAAQAPGPPSFNDHRSITLISSSIQRRNPRSPPTHTPALPRSSGSLLPNRQRLFPLLLATWANFPPTLCSPHLPHAMRV